MNGMSPATTKRRGKKPANTRLTPLASAEARELQSMADYAVQRFSESVIQAKSLLTSMGYRFFNEWRAQLPLGLAGGFMWMNFAAMSALVCVRNSEQWPAYWSRAVDAPKNREPHPTISHPSFSET
jgi:hypothetical protein